MRAIAFTHKELVIGSRDARHRVHANGQAERFDTEAAPSSLSSCVQSDTGESSRAEPEVGQLPLGRLCLPARSGVSVRPLRPD
jgi:hypothetical protein